MTNSQINNPLPTVTMWMGRNIEDLSKEELLEVVQHLGREVRREQENHKQTFRIWEICRANERR